MCTRCVCSHMAALAGTFSRGTLSPSSPKVSDARPTSSVLEMFLSLRSDRSSWAGVGTATLRVPGWGAGGFCFFLCFFTYFWLCWVFIAAHRLSLVVASGDYSSLRCEGFPLWWLLLLQSRASGAHGPYSCGARAQVLCSIWDLPRPGMEPVSPALA